VVELEVGERDVADDRVDAAVRQLRVPKTLDADVLLRVDRLGDAAGDGIEFDADEPLSWLAVAHEVADAAARFEDRGVAGDTQSADGLVDTVDHGWRRVEGIERRPFGTVVFLWGQEGLQLLPQHLPACIAVSAGDGIGEQAERDRPEAGEPGEGLLFLSRGEPAFLFNGFQCADRRNDVAGLRLFTARHAGGQRFHIGGMRRRPACSSRSRLLRPR